MKTKFIVASTVWVLWLATMALWATTFASNATTRGIGTGSWVKMMQNQKTMLNHFATPEQAETFRAEVQKTRDAKDYAAFKKVHEAYGITTYATEEQFASMLQRRADAAARKAAHGIEGKGQRRGIGMQNTNTTNQ